MHALSFAAGAAVGAAAVAAISALLLLERRQRLRPRWNSTHLLHDGSTCTIRTAGPADRASIFGLVRSLAEADGGVHQLQISASDIEEAFDSGAFHAVLCEKDSGSIVGMALVQEIFRTYTGPSLYLQDLIVLEGPRGLGLGTLLLQTLAAVALTRGCNQLFWESHQGNSAANRFYSSTIAAEHTTGDEQLLTWKLVGQSKLATVAGCARAARGGSNF